MFSGLRGIFPSKTKPTFFRRSILFSDNLPWLYLALWYSHHFAKEAYRENVAGTLVLPCAFLNFWSSSKRSSHCLSNFDTFVGDSEQVESVISKICFDGDVTIAIAIKFDLVGVVSQTRRGWDEKQCQSTLVQKRFCYCSVVVLQLLPCRIFHGSSDARI